MIIVYVIIFAGRQIDSKGARQGQSAFTPQRGLPAPFVTYLLPSS